MRVVNLAGCVLVFSCCCCAAGLAGSIPVSSYVYNNLGDLNQVTGKDAPNGAAQSLTDNLGMASDYVPAANFWTAGQEGTIYQEDNANIQSGQPQPSLTFDLGEDFYLSEIVVHYGVLTGSAVMPPTAVEISVDSVPVGVFGGFDSSNNTSSFGDIRSNAIDLAELPGQIVDMRFLGSVSTNPRAGDVAWLGLTEITFQGRAVPEPSAWAIALGAAMAGLRFRKRPK